MCVSVSRSAVKTRALGRILDLSEIHERSMTRKCICMSPLGHPDPWNVQCCAVASETRAGHPSRSTHSRAALRPFAYCFDPAKMDHGLGHSITARNTAVKATLDSLAAANARVQELTDENTSLHEAVESMESRLAALLAGNLEAQYETQQARKAAAVAGRRQLASEMAVEHLKGREQSSDVTTVQNMQLLRLLKSAEARADASESACRAAEADATDMRSRVDRLITKAASAEATVGALRGDVAVAQRARAQAEAEAEAARSLARSANIHVTRPRAGAARTASGDAKDAGGERDEVASEELRLRRERHYALLMQLQTAQDSERAATDRAESAEEAARAARHRLLVSEQRMLQASGAAHAREAELAGRAKALEAEVAAARGRALAAEAEARRLHAARSKVGSSAAKLASASASAEQGLVRAQEEAHRLRMDMAALQAAAASAEERRLAEKEMRVALQREVEQLAAEVSVAARRAAAAEAVAKASRDAAAASAADETAVAAAQSRARAAGAAGGPAGATGGAAANGAGPHELSPAVSPVRMGRPPRLSGQPGVAGEGRAVLSGAGEAAEALRAAREQRSGFSQRALLARLVGSVAAPALALPVATAQHPPSHVAREQAGAESEAGGGSTDLCRALFGVRGGADALTSGRVPLLDLSGLALGDDGAAAACVLLAELPLPLSTASQAPMTALAPAEPTPQVAEAGGGTETATEAVGSGSRPTPSQRGGARANAGGSLGWAPRCVDLRGNGLTDGGARAVAALISPEGGAGMGRASKLRLHSASACRLWDLRGNCIGSAGVAALLDAVRGAGGRALGVEHALEDEGVIKGVCFSAEPPLRVVIDCRQQGSAEDTAEAAAGPRAAKVRGVAAEVVPVASARLAGSRDGEVGALGGSGRGALLAASATASAAPSARWVPSPSPSPWQGVAKQDAEPQARELSAGAGGAAAKGTRVALAHGGGWGGGGGETKDGPLEAADCAGPEGPLPRGAALLPSLLPDATDPAVQGLATMAGDEDDDEVVDTADAAAALRAASQAIDRVDRLAELELKEAREAARRRRIEAMTRGTPGAGPYGAAQVPISLAEQLVPPAALVRTRSGAPRGHAASPSARRDATTGGGSRSTKRAGAPRRSVGAVPAAGSGRAAARARRKK